MVIISVSFVLAAGLGILIPSSGTDLTSGIYTTQHAFKADEYSIEQEFGVQDMIIVLFKDSSILTPTDLNQIKEIDKAFSRIEGIGTVNSLFTARKIKGEEE